jgi:hypothetical protein
VNTALFFTGYGMTGAALLMLFARLWHALGSERLNGQPDHTRCVRPYLVRLPDNTVVFVRASSYANAERVALREARRQQARRQPRSALR